MNRKHLLYVENISPSSSEEHLITYLEKYAPVQQVYFLREKQCTKRSIAALVRVANEDDLGLLYLRNQQNYRGKRLFMVRADETQLFQADHTVIVRNITNKISEENLYDHFEECGKIAFLQIRTDDFAYIGFEDKASVRNAMSKNNMPLKGSNLKIQLLTRNIEIMIVNLDTLQAKMPDLYRRLVLPVEPRQPRVVMQQSPQQQQQQSQPSNQQQPPQETRQQHTQPANQQQVRNQQQQRIGNDQQQQNQRQQFQQLQQQQQKQPQQQQWQSQHQKWQASQQQRQSQYQQQPQQQKPQPMLQQQQPLPQRQRQQPQPQRQQQSQQQVQRQQVSSIQLLKDRANEIAGKQQQSVQQVQQAKPSPHLQSNNQAPVEKANARESIPTTSSAASMETDEVQIIEPPKPVEIIIDGTSEAQMENTSIIPPIPSAYKPQPNDLLRPVKTLEIATSVNEVDNPKLLRNILISNIPIETSLLDVVLYMEQFGDIETCEFSLPKQCHFTRGAKITFTSENGAKKATEYFLHPFRGQYLFVTAANRQIKEDVENVFVFDYLSKYLPFEDVVKSFKHAGDVFYFLRSTENNGKVRIFFLGNVDREAVLAVKSIDGIPVNVEPYTKGMSLHIDKSKLNDYLKYDALALNHKREERLKKSLECFRKELAYNLGHVVNPEGKKDGKFVVIYNVHKSTSEQQISEFFGPIGKPISVRRENLLYEEDFQRVFVGFRTLSMALKASELPADLALNGKKPFIFPGWTKPRMTANNTTRIFFDSRETTIQDIYKGFSKIGTIRFIEKDRPLGALIVWDVYKDGAIKYDMKTGTFGNVNVVNTGKFKFHSVNKNKKSGIFNIECQQLMKDKKKQHFCKRKFEAMKSAFNRSFGEYKALCRHIDYVANVLCKAPTGHTEQTTPDESIVIDDEDDIEVVDNVYDLNTTQSRQAGNNAQGKNVRQSQQSAPQHNQTQKQQQLKQEQLWKRQFQKQQQRFGNKPNPFADNRPSQRHHQRQQHPEQRDPFPEPWQRRDNQGMGLMNERSQQRQQYNQFMSDDRFDNNNIAMNMFERMMPQQFDNFANDQYNDNRFDCGPMDSDDPPLERHWDQQQQQHFNRFSPQHQRTQQIFDREFRHDDDYDAGRDSPGIPLNIPDDQIDEYIMRKQEAIKRRLEQLDQQLISSVENVRHREFESGPRRRQETIFGDNGDVHYVPNPAAFVRNRRNTGPGGGRRGGPMRGNDRENNRRKRDLLERKRDPFADVDIVPIIRISQERSPSPKRTRDDNFDPAQFDAAWN